MNHIVENVAQGFTTIAARTLDGEAATRSLAMLKIDVEGHESQVLAGGARALADPGLLAIEIETVTDANDARLRARGFAEQFYGPATRRLYDSPVDGLKAANRLYLRDADNAQRRVTAAPPRTVGRLVL